MNRTRDLALAALDTEMRQRGGRITTRLLADFLWGVRFYYGETYMRALAETLLEGGSWTDPDSWWQRKAAA